MRDVSMVKRPGKRGTSYQVRWPGPTKGESMTLHNRPDAQRLVTWLRDQPLPLAKHDSAIRRKEYLYGDAKARQLVEESRTVERVAKAFLVVKEETGTGRRTLNNYKIALLTHLRPLYARDGRPRTIDTIDQDDLNALYRRLITQPNERTGKPLMLSTAVGVMARIGGLLLWAYGRRMTEFEAVRARKGKLLKYPSPTLTHSDSRGGLSVEQVDALRDAMDNTQDRLVIRTWVATGARTEEIFALSVSNLRLDAKPPTVTFTHRMEERTREEGTKGRNADETNGGAEARQTVVIDRGLAKALARHVAGRRPGEPVFPRPAPFRGKRSRSVWIDPDSWTRYTFNPVRDELVASGVLPEGVTPYWLRHTTCTMLWDRADSVAQVSQHMRHTDIRTTRVYRDESKVNRALLEPGVNAAFGVFDDNDEIDNAA